jgi:hypothetical protein
LRGRGKSERITIQSTVHPGVGPEPVLIGHVVEDNFLALWRLTPQIGRDRKLFGRPVLRALRPFANWSIGFRRYVGGVPFENRTSGRTFGVQAEYWS